MCPNARALTAASYASGHVSPENSRPLQITIQRRPSRRTSMDRLGTFKRSLG
jgi:hypothetical protein